MATFGIYQALDPLYVTPSGSVCSGKIVGGEAEGRIAIKVFQPPPQADPDEPNWEPKYFLDRAQVQRRVAAAGGAHWAPIYSLGFTPQGGAYYVTDYHALTAQKLIDGRIPLDARGLHAIVQSVLAGLEEIRRIGGRAHANLKPANVLLVGKGPADELRAVLSDPGQEYKAQKEGEAGDLRAVGALIHELVLNRPPTNGEIPAHGDAGWERLGDKAEAWRQVCADLLAHPIAPRVATLAVASKLVEGLAPPRLRVPHLRLPGKSKANRIEAIKVPHAPRRGRVRTPRPPSRFKRRVVQFIAILLLVGGGLGVLSILEASAREELCTARDGWFGSLATSLAEPARRERFVADPHLRRVAEGVDEVEKSGVVCRGGYPTVLGFLELQKTREAVAALRRVEQDLAPDSWPQLVPLRELAKSFEKRGWQQPASYIGQLLEGVRPTPTVSTAMSRPSMVAEELQPDGGTLAQRIERVLRLRPIIEEQAASAEGDWKQLDETTAFLESSKDPIIHGFGALLRRETIGAIRLTHDGFEGLAQLKQNAGMATQVAEAVRTAVPGQLDAVRFANEVVAGMNPADLELADVRRWLNERPRYAVRREEIVKAADELQKSFDATAGEVAKSAPDPAEAPAFKLELEGLEAALRDFRQTPFIERDIVAGKLGHKVAEIQGQIAQLKRYYHAEDATDWLENLAGIATTSDRLKQMWDAWVDTLHADLETMANDREMFARNKQRTDKLRDVLQDLEREAPHPPTDLTQDFAAAARQRREERLDALVSAIDTTDPAIKPETIGAVVSELKTWFADLQALNRDFPVRKKIFTLDDRPDEPWRKKEDFWKDPIVQRLIRDDMGQIERLQKLRSAPREKLVEAAQDNTVRHEVVLAAWELLGDNRISPDWPASVAELKAEEQLRLKVASCIQQLEPTERRPFDQLLKREGPRRWRRFVESADSEEMLVAALERQLPFEIDAVILGDMNAEARFNVWLCLANSVIMDDAKPATRKKTDEELDVIISNLLIAARELDEPRASQVRDKLAKLKVPEPFSDRQPGEVFRLPLRGTEEVIELRRVEPKPNGNGNGSLADEGVRPFYLGTREITLAQFVAGIDALRAWEEARALSWPYRPGKEDPRRGPRIWEWVDLAAPRLAPPQLWLTFGDASKRNDFPREFRADPKFNRNALSAQIGGMPSERHPMQYISAQAALYYAAALGCRLPTSSEWNAALAASGKTLKNGNWNLRDETWEIFRRYAAKEAIAPEHWPDRGAFPGDPSASAPPAPSRRGNDGAFLFRPAVSEGEAFADLIGNVAEYVCEAPDAFARHEKQTPEDIKRFLTDTSSAPNTVGVIAVMGGSAISSPEIPLDEPQRVARTDRGYSDVGLRLAFTAPARNRAERLKWVLAGEQYVWPRTVSADTRER